MSKDVVAEVLSRVPATQFVDGRFILYDKLTFGRSPNWAAAKPLAKAVACMLQHTGGVQALQVPFTQGAEAYFTVNQMKVKKNEAEACAFRLRALTSQLASQKAKGRVIPAAYMESFGLVMDLIVVTPTTPRPPTATRVPRQSGGAAYSVSSSDDEMRGNDWDRSELLTSHDADLVALLQPESEMNADAEADAKDADAKKSGTKEADAKKSDTKEANTKKADTKEADTKKPDAEADAKNADAKKSDTKESDTTKSEEADAKKVEAKEADAAAVPAASPLADQGLQTLMGNPFVPPGSDDWKGLQKQIKEESVDKAKAAKEAKAKAKAAKGSNRIQRKPAAARKRPAAAPPEHAIVDAAPAEGIEAIGDVAPVDGAAAPDPATMSDDDWRKFLNREHSKVYGKQLTQMKKTVSKERALAAAQSAATAWTDELREKYQRPKKQRKQ